MSRTVIATAAWIVLMGSACCASAQSLLPAADSGYDNYYSFSSASSAAYSLAVPAGGSYSGISTTVGSGVNVLGSTAELVGGSNTSGSPTTITMTWRNRADVETAAGGTHPPLPVGEAYLASDVVDLEGVQGVMALQMNYSPAVESATDAHFDSLDGALFLGWLDPTSQSWVNAANMSPTIGTDSKGPYQGSFANFCLQHAGQPLADYVGYWGVNTSGNDDLGNDDTVWAVVDGLNGQFAVVPEPGTVTLLAAGGLSLLAYAWRRRKVAASCVAC
jgi:hypothetical protein